MEKRRREEKRREGKGREGKGREGKGREGKGSYLHLFSDSCQHLCAETDKQRET
jgi:hypothetical protein